MIFASVADGVGGSHVVVLRGARIGDVATAGTAPAAAAAQTRGRAAAMEIEATAAAGAGAKADHGSGADAVAEEDPPAAALSQLRSALEGSTRSGTNIWAERDARRAAPTDCNMSDGCI